MNNKDYKKYWRSGLILFIVMLLTFGIGVVGFSVTREGPIIIDSSFDPEPDYLWNEYGYGCEDLIAFKIDEQNPTGTYVSEDGLFSVTVETDVGLTWSSNLPVYYVYAKGGPGGNLYIYPGGALEDDGSSGAIFAPKIAIGKGSYDISHITFYYCLGVEELTVEKTVDTS